MAVSRDGRWYATAERVWSRTVLPERPGEPRQGRFWPETITLHQPSAVRLWETETGKPLAALEGHLKGVNDVVIS
ncbi:MAG: hypothetical protein RMJ82_14175, partial [Gemmatales bacterium]|nr:hypothetical protein [Gemmatales bacterium]